MFVLQSYLHNKVLQSRIASKKSNPTRNLRFAYSDEISWLPQNYEHYNTYMHLMMSGKERFVLRSRLLYGKCTTRSQKSAIIDDLMQYIGYKSRKYAITVLTQSQNRQKRKKKGRRKILDTKQVDLLREIWAGMGYPCAKLMQPMLQDWVESRRKSQDFPAEYSDIKLPELSAATIDRALSAFKLNGPKSEIDVL